MPYGQDGEELEKTNQHIDQFVKQINELRYEKQEILNDYYDFRIKLEKNVDIEDEKDLHSLKDDV